MNWLAGTPTLVRLALRRERGIAPWWMLLLVALALVMVAYIRRNMGAPELLATYVEVINRNSFFRRSAAGSWCPTWATWRPGAAAASCTC